MKLDQCVECGKENINEIVNNFEFNNQGKLHVIENVPAFQCADCLEVYYGVDGSRYIDTQVELIKAGEGDK